MVVALTKLFQDRNRYQLTHLANLTGGILYYVYKYQ